MIADLLNTAGQPALASVASRRGLQWARNNRKRLLAVCDSPELRQLLEIGDSEAAHKTSVLVQLFAFAQGGMERWFVDLARQLPEIDWHVWIPDGVPTTPAISSEISSLATIHQGVSQWPDACKCEIAILSSPVPWGWEGPAIAVAHGAGRIARHWMDELAWCAEHVAVSDAATEVISGPSTVVRNGIDLTRCEQTIDRDTSRHAWGVDDDEFVIGYVGRFSPEKRLETIVDAAAETDAVAVFVGQALGRDAQRSRESLQEYAKQNDVRAIFPGARFDVGNVFAAFDVAMIASESEGYCLSAIEALASGCPLVATRVGVLPELTRELGPICAFVDHSATRDDLSASIVAAQQIDSRQVQARIRQACGIETTAKQWSQLLRNYSTIRDTNERAHNGSSSAESSANVTASS